MNRILPLLQQPRLVKSSVMFRLQSSIRWKHTDAIPFRDFIEQHNRKYIMKRQNFFSKHMQPNQSNLLDENLIDYDPILTQCMARWLWLNYKVTDYPYHDLNILNIFTDLPQAIYFMRRIMQYFHDILPSESFERINYYLFPLYQCAKINKRNLLDDIPGNVRIMKDMTLFPMNKTIDFNDRTNNVYINDPMQILMFNDILGNLSHDLVKYHDVTQQWEQCYIEEETIKNMNERYFDDELDYWCDITIRQLFDTDFTDQIQRNKNLHNEIFIPTQFIQLLEQLKLYVPDFRLFIIDSSGKKTDTFYSRLRDFLGYTRIGSSKILEPYDNWWVHNCSREDQAKNINPCITFQPDFNHLEKILTNVSENDTRYGFLKPCEIETLGEFCDKWVDHKIKETKTSVTTSQDNNSIPTEFLQKLKLQLDLSTKSSLNILHS